MPFSSFFLRHRRHVMYSRPLRFIHKSDLTFIHVPDATPPYISSPRVTDSNFRQATICKKLALGTCSAPIIHDVIGGFDETNATCTLRVREVKENVCIFAIPLNRAPIPLHSLSFHTILREIKFIKSILIINLDINDVKIVRQIIRILITKCNILYFLINRENK